MDAHFFRTAKMEGYRRQRGQMLRGIISNVDRHAQRGQDVVRQCEKVGERYALPPLETAAARTTIAAAAQAPAG